MSKILVIDDHRINIVLIEETMAKFLPEVKVLEALSGKIGIQIAKDEKPDAILLDIMMPEMDGFEVCVALKSEPMTRTIPIVLVSAYVKDSESITKGLNLGADAFLTKPIQPAELAAQVKVVLRIKQAEKQIIKEGNKYKSMTRTLPDAVTTIDLNNRITYSSDQAGQLFACKTPDDLYNKDIFELFHPEDKAEAKKFIKRVKKENIVKDADFQFVRKDQSVFPGEISASLIINEKKEAVELIVVIRDISNRRISENKILDYQGKLKTLNSMLTLAEEKERKLIAEALHDGFGQTLAIIKLRLTSLLNDKLAIKTDKVIKESIVLLDNAISETKSLTYDLYPPLLYELGLHAAIKWKLDKVNAEYPIKTSYKSKIDNNFLNSDLNILLFRIISELLNNIVKHANATNIIVQLIEDQQNIILNIIDNGIGFNVDFDKYVANKGFGLFNITERIDSVQGSMKIDSRIGKGTKIVIQIPIINI
jgi:PAS domain S-box-containing protein